MIRLTRGLGVAFAGSFLATEGRIKVNLSGILGIYTLIALSHFAVCLVTNREDSKGADQCPMPTGDSRRIASLALPIAIVLLVLRARKIQARQKAEAVESQKD